MYVSGLVGEIANGVVSAIFPERRVCLRFAVVSKARAPSFASVARPPPPPLVGVAAATR